MTTDQKKRWAAFVCAVLALITHLYLAIQGYQLKLGTAGKSVCNLNSTFNCDAVALSKFAELFGIPLAVWGFAFNLVLTIFIFMGALKLSAPQNRIDRITWFLAGFSAAVSVLMAAISVFNLGTYCLFCIATYIFSFLIFFFVHSTRERGGSLSEDLPSLFRESKGLGILIALIPLGALGFNKVAMVEFGFEQNAWRVNESINAWQVAPDQAFPAELGVKYKPADGKYTITMTEFADFLCPHCKTAAGPLHAFADSNPEVQLVFIPFPLDGSCNPGIPNKGDGLRCNLAATMLCAEKLAGKGFLAHDKLFDKQAEMTASLLQQELKSLAETLAIPLENLNSCIESADIKDVLAKGADTGVKAKILGTPSIFANGKKLENGQYYPVLQSLQKLVKGSK